MNFDTQPAPNINPILRAMIWGTARTQAREDLSSLSSQEKEDFLCARGWADSKLEEDAWYCDLVFNNPDSPLPGEPPSLPTGQAFLLARTFYYVERLSWAAGYDKCRGVLPEPGEASDEH